MPNGWTPDLTEIPTDEALTLVVAERTRTGIQAWVVSLRSDAEAVLRTACEQTLADLGGRESVEFSPDVHIEEEEFLAVPLGVVGADHPVLQTLEGAGAFDQLHWDSIPRLWFYAVLVGNDPDNRTAFVRKADPHAVGRGGRFLMSLGDNLRLIDRPVFVIDERFDVVVTDEGLAVLNLPSFETLFRGADQMQARVETWVTAISDSIPLDRGGLRILTDAGRRNSRLARRMRSIYERGHLRDIPIERIRKAAEGVGLPDNLFDAAGLVVTDATDLTVLLRFLNEDLFEGVLTGQEFAADRKRPV